jgi:hypothetical protein
MGERDLRDEDICKALKELAVLKDEGLLTEEQYLEEVNAVIAKRAGGADSTPLACDIETSAHPGGEELEDGEYRDPEDRYVHPPEEVVTAILDRNPVHTAAKIIDEPPPEDDGNYFEQQIAPQGRVLVSGKAPWDDEKSGRFRIDTKDKDNKEDLRQDRKSIYQNVILRERLAHMAQETNRRMNIRKNENLAFGISLILPGLGHLYLGMLGIGSALVVIAGVLIVLHIMSETSMWSVIFPFWLLGALLAYKHAQKYNFLIDRKKIGKRRSGAGLSTTSIEKSPYKE